VPALQFGLNIRPRETTGGEQYPCMIYQIGNFCDNIRAGLRAGLAVFDDGLESLRKRHDSLASAGDSGPDMARADDDPFVGGEFTQPHRPARVQALSGDSHLGPQA
jgi:hypothetical protein